MAVLAVLQTGGCGAGQSPPAPLRRPLAAQLPSPRAAAAAPYQTSPGTNASLWRLRAGLNVAALSCRTHTPVAAAYGRVLSRHRALLASAYQAEQRRLGMARFDHEQTRIYNRFANQRSPQTFCRSAAELANRAAAMESARLAPAAPHLAAELEAQLR